MKTIILKSFSLAILLSVSLISNAAKPSSNLIVDIPKRTKPQDTTCAGIRGNGQNLFAHYGALARHIEEYDMIECAAGGSSGSITTFLLESMWANPVTHFCPNSKKRCRARVRANMSLMLKSVVGLTETGLFGDVATVNELITRISENNILALLENDNPTQGVEALIRVLRDLGPLINPELIQLLLTSPDPIFHATDIIDGLEKGVQFIVDDPRVFLRTSVLDFNQVAELFGLYGSFYAGYGPTDQQGMLAWVRACAKPSVGLTWQEIELLPATEGRTCKENFNDLFNAYREEVAANGGQKRIDDPVGKYLPTFGVTGVLKGNAIALWQDARAAWIAASPTDFVPNFSDIGVGYWGNTRELRKIARKLSRNFDDLNSEQFTLLGPATWREVLKSSPAEPGFSPGVPLESGFVSVGGWADPLRVLPLEALGAKRTIAINRLGGVGGFTEAATRLLNASDADIAALYSTVDPYSSFYQGLEQASGIWCTDWDSQDSDPNRLFNDAYNSPLITEKRRFYRPRFGYENVGSQYDFPIGGCAPGVQVNQ